MTKRVTPVEVHAWVEESFQGRADVGFGKAIANLILEPLNPFEPGARRRPNKGFLLGALLLTATFVIFIYFNFVR